MIGKAGFRLGSALYIKKTPGLPQHCIAAGNTRELSLKPLIALPHRR